MILKTKKEITEALMTRSFLWKIDTNYCLKKKLDLRWREEQDSIEEWMKLLNAENKLKISSICFLKRVDKTWSFKMNKQDQKECWMKNSLRLEKIEMKAMLKVTKSLILDLKLLNLKEILT